MQHCAAFATLHTQSCSYTRMKTKNSRNIQHLPQHASTMPDREYILQKYTKFQTSRNNANQNCIHEEIQNKYDSRNPC